MELSGPLGNPTDARTCETCGATFVPVQRGRPNRFCSWACYVATRPKPSERACERCGAVFRPTHNAGAAHRNRFCSRACAARASRKAPAGDARLAAAFWERVDRSGGPESCWVWQGVRANGYGRWAPRGWHTGGYAHRVAWELTRGPIPEGMSVLHRCDNPPCANPDHLFLGTQADNVADRDQKGRQAAGDRNGARLRPERLPRGERHGQAKLTAAQAATIRERYAAGGLTHRQLARQYGVGKATVGRIVRGENWRPGSGA